jgi:hypothetical protein
MASKGQSGLKSVEVDPCQVCSTALGVFKRTHGRKQGAAVERRPSQPASHAETLAGPGSYLRSTVCPMFDHKYLVPSNARPAFERSP